MEGSHTESDETTGNCVIDTPPISDERLMSTNRVRQLEPLERSAASSCSRGADQQLPRDWSFNDCKNR